MIEVGGAGTLPVSIKQVRRGGQMALIGVLTGQGEMDPHPVLVHRFSAGDLIFGFEEAPEAMRYMGTGAHFGKVCVRV